ncbi:MAG: hypothetical protein ACRCZI_09645, partial [Cetobacterium sp.]
TVRAWASATVLAWDSATVRASGSATVRAWASATVEASGSATVEASGSVTVRASGSATVRASDWVAVHQHSDTAEITGGVVIRPPDLTAAENWCAYHGVEVIDGVATLYKAVDDAWTTTRKTSYAPGSVPVAPDWDPKPRECGGGIHLCARPWIAKDRYHQRATRFVGVPVRVAEIRVHPGDTNKVRVPRACAAVYEVDIDGEAL